MSKHDSELREVSGHDFVMRLNDEEKHRWLEIVDDPRVADALIVCIHHQQHATKQQVLDAQARRAAKSAEVSADRRHGEEMTAAAFANNLARKAICRAHVGIALAVLAIVVTIGIAVWQYYQG